MDSSEYERTTKNINLTELVPVKENPSHLIYNCPECITKRGKPDLDGKLYFNKLKHVGLCFKCNTAFVEKHAPVEVESSDEFDEGKEAMLSVLDTFSMRIKEQSPIKCSPIQFNFEPLNSSLLDFLKQRNLFLPQLVDYLNLRGYYGDREGVVTPFYFQGEVCMYQVRFNTTDHKYRHYTSPGEKLLYSPNRIFDDASQKKSVTICEGTFDAIALMMMGFDNPLAVLGSSITENQIKMLNMIGPEVITIAMDKPEIGMGIRKSLIKSVTTVSDIEIKNFGGVLDPEEFMVVKSSKDMKSFMDITKQVTDILTAPPPPKFINPDEYYLSLLGVSAW